MGSCPVSTPIDYNTRIHHNSRLHLPDPSSYRCLIGRLIYLTNTQSDITYVVQHVSQFIYTPTTAHQQVVACILRYIKGAPSFDLF